MPYKVFIDGEEGTTGLKINEYFRTRDNIELLHIDREKRKDPEERLRLIKKADVSFLCLPDAASREIAAAAPGECRILDTSTAHRTSPQWVYGMPELCESQREKIRESSRVAVPGCHATGVILLIKPLLDEGMLSEDYPFSAFSITGYSGGGKKMIAEYRNEDRQTKPEKEDPLKSPRQYGITQHHKHLPEIMKATGLSALPSFIPVVADYYSGMEVIVPIKADMLKTGGREPLAAVRELFRERYINEPMVRVTEKMDDGGFIAAGRLAETNRLEISAEGNEENIILTATYDNLGKGASGAAVQNMNIMLGIDEEKGLV